MGIIWTIIIGFVAGVIAKLVMNLRQLMSNMGACGAANRPWRGRKRSASPRMTSTLQSWKSESA